VGGDPPTPTSAAAATDASGLPHPHLHPTPAEDALLAAFDACDGVGDARCNGPAAAAAAAAGGGGGGACGGACPAQAPTSARLLVHQSQVGGLLGRGGAIAAGLRAATGAGLRVLPHRQAGCAAAGPADALVAVSGFAAAVRAGRAAVDAIAARMPPAISDFIFMSFLPLHWPQGRV
jgi:hypothetical protein